MKTKIDYLVNKRTKLVDELIKLEGDSKEFYKDTPLFESWVRKFEKCLSEGSVSDIGGKIAMFANSESNRKFGESFEGEEGAMNNSVASRLITAINDEWKTIDLYNSIISELSMTNDDTYKKMIPVIEDIVNEENVHVGQLQKALELISPDTADIAKGEKEAEEQIVGGDPSDDLKALVGEEYDDDLGVEEEDDYTVDDLPFNEDDEIGGGLEWYATDVKEIPYGRNQKRIRDRKLVDTDKEPVRKPIKEDFEEEVKVNADTIRDAVDSGTISKDAIVDYVLKNTPDEMLSGVVSLIGDSGDTTVADDDEDSTTVMAQDVTCANCDDLADGEDIRVEENGMGEVKEDEVPTTFAPIEVSMNKTSDGMTVISAVAPTEKDALNAVADMVYGNTDDDNVDINGI